MPEKALLEIRDLKMYFTGSAGGWLDRTKTVVKAVDGVSLDVHRGETFGLVGESGCGKTTLGRCALKLVQPTDGAIRFDGDDITHYSRTQMRPLRRRMQIIFQDPYSSLDPRHTVSHIVGEPMIVHALMTSAQRWNRLEELMDLVGMHADHLHRYPHEFSGGQRQRICIARALSLDPELIIADEPVSALDVSIQAQILNLMVDLRERLKLTYIFISHDLSVVRHIADRVAVMYLGRIVESAAASDLFAHPRHPYTRALLSAVPVANPHLQGHEVVLEGDIPSPINPPSGCVFHPRCPSARPDCRDRVPQLEALDGGHLAACHYPL